MRRFGSAAARFNARVPMRCFGTQTTVLSYQKPHAALPTGRYIDQADKGDVVDEVAEQSVLMRNARERTVAPTLAATGFALVRHESAVSDFRDAAEVESAYYAEVEALVKAETGAARVYVFDATVRETGATSLNAAAGGSAAPVPRVHCDYTDAGAPRRLRQLAADGLLGDEDADAIGRFAFMNVWRSIDREAPIKRSPLALCDCSSVPAADRFVYELRFPDRTGENYSLEFSDAHEWSYYPAMTADEALLFTVYDRRGDGPRFVFHTAFEEEGTKASDPPRTSIEVRCVAVFDDERPKFFDMKHSNNAARVRLWLRKSEPEVSEKIERVVLDYESLASEDYAEVNPLRKCPALTRADGGGVFESDVILSYLEDRYGDGTFTPATAEARQTARLMIRCHDLYVASPNCTADGFSHSQGAMYLSGAWHGERRAMRAADREAKIAELHRQLAWLEGAAVGPYLAGDALSTADFTWFPTLVFMEYMLPRVFGWPDPCDPAVSEFPRIAAWYRRCRSDAAFDETRAEIRSYWVEMDRAGQFAPIEAELAANPGRTWAYPSRS